MMPGQFQPFASISNHSGQKVPTLHPNYQGASTHLAGSTPTSPNSDQAADGRDHQWRHPERIFRRRKSAASSDDSFTFPQLIKAKQLLDGGNVNSVFSNLGNLYSADDPKYVTKFIPGVIPYTASHTCTVLSLLTEAM
jgi:hypothetical protein